MSEFGSRLEKYSKRKLGPLKKIDESPPQFNINGFGLPPPPLCQTLRKTTLLGYTGGFGNSGHAILSGILF